MRAQARARVQAVFEAAVEAGCEGLMAKQLSSRTSWASGVTRGSSSRKTTSMVVGSILTLCP